jgi:hypothetical protein
MTTSKQLSYYEGCFSYVDKKISFIYALACTLSGILESNIVRGGVFGSRVKRH